MDEKRPIFITGVDVAIAGLVTRKARKVALTSVVQMDKPFQCQTMEGLVDGKAGDYLAIGVKNEVWPIAKEVFEMSYEFVQDLDDMLDQITPENLHNEVLDNQ